MTRIGFVRRGILNDSRSFAAALLWSVLVVAVATGVRMALDPWVHGLPYLTFFPAVLIAAILLGGLWGWAGDWQVNFAWPQLAIPYP